MIKRKVEKDYKYSHPFGDIVVDEVTVGVSQKGRRSLAASEVTRLSRLAALEFLKKNYSRALTDPDFQLSSKVVRAIIAFLGVNQNEFGLLVGCQKAKVSKILSGEQDISKSQALLAIERIAMELGRPGSVRKILGDEELEIPQPDDKVAAALVELRFKNINKTA